MNPKHKIRLDATITQLNIRQACASLGRATASGNLARAKKLRTALKLARARLHEVLDYAVVLGAKPYTKDEERARLGDAAMNIALDLEAIEAAIGEPVAVQRTNLGAVLEQACALEWATKGKTVSSSR